jgi:hypothetical protein
MTVENQKKTVVVLLILALIAAWYFWTKSKALATSAAITAAGSETLKSATIASQTTAGEKKTYTYPFGLGGFTFERIDPSTLKDAELLSNFTPKLKRSAFLDN